MIKKGCIADTLTFDGEKYRTNSYNQVLDLIYQETKQLREGNVKKRREVTFSPILYPDPIQNREFKRNQKN